MAWANLQLRLVRSPVLRYGLAATSFAIALGLALLEQRYGFRDLEVPLFLFAITLTAWYAGPCPRILAAVLLSLPEQQSDQIFNTFFTTKRQGIGMGLSISRALSLNCVALNCVAAGYGLRKIRGAMRDLFFPQPVFSPSRFVHAAGRWRCRYMTKQKYTDV